jgi:hypothetical protein
MRRLLPPVLTVLFALSAAEAETTTSKDAAKKSTPKTTQKARLASTSLTGCLDQQGETYVLRELATAGAVSTLKGKAFSDDNFARYVGHKVTVHGTVQKEGETSVVQVNKVDDAGPGCSAK